MGFRLQSEQGAGGGKGAEKRDDWSKRLSRNQRQAWAWGPGGTGHVLPVTRILAGTGPQGQREALAEAGGGSAGVGVGLLQVSPGP